VQANIVAIHETTINTARADQFDRSQQLRRRSQRYPLLFEPVPLHFVGERDTSRRKVAASRGERLGAQHDP